MSQENNLRILELYVRQIDRINNIHFVDGGAKIALNIRQVQGRELLIDSELPGDNDLSAFLLALRPVITQREDIYFYKIVNAIYAIIDEMDPRHPYKKGVEAVRQAYADTLNKPFIKYTLNGERITAIKLIDLWFNAYYFHIDKSKIPEFEKLREAMGHFFQFMFVESLVELTNHASWLGSLAKELLSREERSAGVSLS